MAMPARNREKIEKVIKERPGVSVREIVEEVGCSGAFAYRIVGQLQDEGLVIWNRGTSNGEHRGGVWWKEDAPAEVVDQATTIARTNATGFAVSSDDMPNLGETLFVEGMRIDDGKIVVTMKGQKGTYELREA